jgi:hypothetical protein
MRRPEELVGSSVALSRFEFDLVWLSSVKGR